MIQDREIQRAMSDVRIAMVDLFAAAQSKILIDAIREANYEWINAVETILRKEGFEP